MQKIGQRLLAGSIGLVAMGAVASPALAAGNDPVLAAIKHESRAVQAAAKGVKSIGKVTTPTEAQAAEPKLKTLVMKFEHAATVVSHAKATDGTQRRARADWVRGDRDAVKAYKQLEIVLKDLAAGNKTAARSAELKAKKPLLDGFKLEVKALKLLEAIKSSGAGA